MENIDDLLKELKDLRTTLESVKSDMKDRLEAFQNSGEYKDLRESRLRIDSKIAILEDNIREIAKIEYETSGNKKPHDKVSVKIFNVFKVTDTSKVYEWCQRYFVGALKPDMKMVEDYVKSNQPFDGVELTTEPKVMIAGTL